MATSGSEEFPELKRPNFEFARSHATWTMVLGAVLVVMGIVFALAQSEPIALLISALGAVMIGISVLMRRWMHRVEQRVARDPNANPQNNAFNRGLLRLRRDHPVLYGLLTVVVFGLLVATMWWRFTS